MSDTPDYRIHFLAKYNIPILHLLHTPCPNLAIHPRPMVLFRIPTLKLTFDVIIDGVESSDQYFAFHYRQ